MVVQEVRTALEGSRGRVQCERGAAGSFKTGSEQGLAGVYRPFVCSMLVQMLQEVRTALENLQGRVQRTGGATGRCKRGRVQCAGEAAGRFTSGSGQGLVGVYRLLCW